MASVDPTAPHAASAAEMLGAMASPPTQCVLELFDRAAAALDDGIDVMRATVRIMQRITSDVLAAVSSQSVECLVQRDARLTRAL